MPDCWILPSSDLKPIQLKLIAHGELESVLKEESEFVRAWIHNIQFRQEAGHVAFIPDDKGQLERVWAFVGAGADCWDFGGLPKRLPSGVYALDRSLNKSRATMLALGWGLGSYMFERYKPGEGSFPQLVWPENADRAFVQNAVTSIHWVRDLINTPAEDMGPAELAEAACDLARRYNATCKVFTGDELLAENYPAVHAIGRASTRAPRLIDIVWGRDKDPKVTLVGKGVCFDSGGINLKSWSDMKLMKKDMGGAANVLGLAQMLMQARLPIRLRVLIPAVENSVSGSAVRPLDIIPTRKGIPIEIGHTDAEGRVILADALYEAVQERPDLVVDMATLTGAARIALGTEVPALFCNHEPLASAMMSYSNVLSDPMWRLPLWSPYRKMLNSQAAYMNNVAENSYAGAIVAALFMEEFVGEGVPWIHLDMMAWNVSESDGRPYGGEAMGIRAVFGLIQDLYGRKTVSIHPAE